jgi:hypothetical protein
MICCIRELSSYTTALFEQVGMAHEEALGPKKINADGTIVQQSYEEVSKKTGFRPGRLSLRSIKMKWTLADFMAMDDEFTFKIKRQVHAITLIGC